MPSACNTLPSLNDPSLDALQIARHPYELSPEQITSGLEETQSIPDFKNLAAKHLFEHGHHSKAIAREDCSKFCLFERCDGTVSPRGDAHTHPIYITCRQRYCKYCGSRRQRENVERWYANHPYLRDRHNFLYIELSHDYDGIPTPQIVEYFNQDVLQYADIAEQGRVSGTGAVWNTVIRHIGDGRYRLVAKFIWWGDWDKDADYDCWWQFTLDTKIQVVPACSFDVALKQMLDQEIPEDPIQSAHYEMAIQDVRTSHCAGGFIRAKNDGPDTAVTTSPDNGLPDISEELFPTTEPLGNYSGEITPNAKLTTPKKHRTCKTCGAPITKRSGKVSVDLTLAEIEALPMYDIQPPG